MSGAGYERLVSGARYDDDVHVFARSDFFRHVAEFPHGFDIQRVQCPGSVHRYLDDSSFDLFRRRFL